MIGISKLSRLVRLMARQPVLQEDLTHQLAELLQRLESSGAAAYVEGLHLCMASRGIEAHEARVVTSAVRGVLVERPAARQEFLALVIAPPAAAPLTASRRSYPGWRRARQRRSAATHATPTSPSAASPRRSPRRPPRR